MLAIPFRLPKTAHMDVTRAAIQSLAEFGSRGMVIDVECHLSNSLPNIVIVGFANKAVDESKERIRGAFASSNIQLPRKRITINLAPADLPKDSSSFDLAIAAAILSVGGLIHHHFLADQAVIGELGLTGEVRPVRGIIGKLLAGRAAGITTFYIPQANVNQALLVPGLQLVPINHLQDFYRYLNEPASQPLLRTEDGKIPDEARHLSKQQIQLSIDEIIGQATAKRALEIAAAGGHNIFFNGPPGTGKSMLAKALSSIMPELGREEILEITHLHSLAGKDYERIITERPFRAPHHSASHAAIVGGGHSLRPGEISLSHRGVLFFDELPEFARQTIEALRQPLEDRVISVARAKDTAEYPADFIFVATANPCPCGYYGTSRECSCPPHRIERYRQKLSGPILDRIDLYAEVSEVDHARLLTPPPTHSAAAIRQRIMQARQIQAQRYGTTARLNATMDNVLLRQHAHLNKDSKTLLDKAGARLDLSARAYMRAIKVARTIADLAGAKDIELMHITEALQYRSHAYAQMNRV